MNSNTLFWIVNAAGWITYLLLASLFFGYFTGGISSTMWYINLASFAYYVPITGCLRWLIKKMGWFENQQLIKLILVLVGINYLIALVGQFLVSLVMMYGLGMMDWSSYSVNMLMITSGQQWFVLGLWSLLYLVIKQLRRSRQQQMTQLQLESALQANELRALKAQLNPHFIFNCLNNMRALAIDDSQTTRQMITHLSEILKYSFQYGEQTTVSVEREIQHVNNYLALESIQFEQRLTYDTQVDAATQQALIPTLAIQLLVENAIKHGIMKLPNGGHIQINVTGVGAQLIITVTNTGTLPTEPNPAHNDRNHTRVGLSNLKQRLHLMYGDRAELSIQALSDERVAVQIKLPLEMNHD
ncbi:sensor histidine kinase [Marinicella meishanensis]|uniref:sensor histidine kinase n=1 Tax=Marinicella meishanensis TaxID=2873263 RepID=UPI001CBF557D|nr:histidine kinase [Marinicella sp. NBU2979]